MHKSVETAIDEIDAAIFSGDEFIDLKNRKELRGMMARWERGLKEFDRIDGEANEQD